MNITVSIVIATISLISGEITKLLPIQNKYIPLQNLLIAFFAILVCTIFKVENMSLLETIVTCVFASMSAGGIADIKKYHKKIKKERRNKI